MLHAFVFLFFSFFKIEFEVLRISYSGSVNTRFIFGAVTAVFFIRPEGIYVPLVIGCLTPWLLKTRFFPLAFNVGGRGFVKVCRMP